MMPEKPLFAAAINCMDGRVQQPVADYLKKRLGVDYVDMITEPGPDGILAHMIDYEALRSIRKRLDLSVQHHGSQHIAVIGHHDCRRNPVNAATHQSHIRSAVQCVRIWYRDLDIFGLWVNENWEVEEL